MIKKSIVNFLKYVLRRPAGWLLEQLIWLSDDVRKYVANYVMPRGKFFIEHYREGKLLQCLEVPNGIVDVGLNNILDVAFGGATQITSWYIGIVDNSGFSAFASADTHASHAGWNEFTSYSDATRQAWGAGTAATRSITNASPATFNINGSGTLKGIFVSDFSTKGSTASGHILWSTAAFASTVPVVNGDQLKVTYTVSG